MFTRKRQYSLLFSMRSGNALLVSVLCLPDLSYIRLTHAGKALQLHAVYKKPYFLVQVVRESVSVLQVTYVCLNVQ